MVLIKYFTSSLKVGCGAGIGEALVFFDGLVKSANPFKYFMSLIAVTYDFKAWFLRSIYLNFSFEESMILFNDNKRMR